MKQILHICAGWEKWNGAANIARLIAKEQEEAGNNVTLATWATICQLRNADEVWVHCGWLPCLWWAALWGRNVHWLPEACYDPVRLKYHCWKKWLVGPIERFCLRRCKTIVATCEAEKVWIQDYLGNHCPPVEVTDIKRFFNLTNLNPVNPVNPVKKKHHLLYLGRRHPLKGLNYLEAAVRQLQPQIQTVESRSDLLSTVCKLQVVSNAFGDELEKVWNWCDVLVLPTLSDNFGLVVAEALERGKRVITTDGAPAWGEGMELRVESGGVKSVGVGSEIWSGYGGRLIYLKGYRDGTDETRVELLKRAIERLCK